MISDEDYGREAAKGVNERYPGLGDVVGRCLVGWEVEIPVIVYRGLMVKLGDWLNARAVSDTSRVPEDTQPNAEALLQQLTDLGVQVDISPSASGSDLWRVAFRFHGESTVVYHERCAGAFADGLQWAQLAAEFGEVPAP